jgi:hypothetical protein
VSTHYSKRTVIVAVITVRVMQVAVDQIVNMVSMGYSFVAAAGAVYMVGIVTVAAVAVGAAVGVGSLHVDNVLVNMITVGVVQVAIVQVIDVAVVLDGGVTAVGAVLVVVVRMFVAAHVYLLVLA